MNKYLICMALVCFCTLTQAKVTATRVTLSNQNTEHTLNTSIDDLSYLHSELGALLGDAQVEDRVAIVNSLDAQIASDVAKSKTVKQGGSIDWQMKNRANMVGRFVVSSVGIDVAIFDSGHQAAVDAIDSAYYFPLGDMMVIGDHDQQGFKAIMQMQIGTTAYIDNGVTIQRYITTAAFPGHNTEYELTDNNYNNIHFNNPGGLTLYTCNGRWQDVWIVFLQPY